jgi:hypothetical protein
MNLDGITLTKLKTIHYDMEECTPRAEKIPNMHINTFILIFIKTSFMHKNGLSISSKHKIKPPHKMLEKGSSDGGVWSSCD